MNKIFLDDAWEELVYWTRNDRKTTEKIYKLIRSIERNGPMKGEGKPEKLKYKKNEYSRHIDDTNRLIYAIEGDKLFIKSCKGHYEDY